MVVCLSVLKGGREGGREGGEKSSSSLLPLATVVITLHSIHSRFKA